nr:hypothetical protein [Klebsiella michiganensis]
MIVPVSVPVYGENYRWKTVTAVRLVPFGTGTEWIITTGDITVSSGSVSLDTPANLGSNGGLLVANALTANGDFWGTSDVATSYPQPGVPYKGTWREVLNASVDSVRNQISIRNYSVVGGSSTVCFGYTLREANGNFNFSDLVYPPGAGSGINCMTAPPLNEWCAMSVPQVTLSFGTLMLDQAAGKTADSTVGVSCTSSSVSYVLKLQTGNTYIPLSNGMRANLGLGAANSAPGNTTYSGSQSSLRLRGTLAGTPTSTGAFNGTGVMMVVYN